MVDEKSTNSTTDNGTDFHQQVADYRKLLLETQARTQDVYDKAVLTLSGGSYGLSMMFLKDIAIKTPLNAKMFLIVAWACWGLSICLIFISYFTSLLAYERAIKQIDEKTAYVERFGGYYNVTTKYLNWAAGGFFLLGVLLQSKFIYCNFN